MAASRRYLGFFFDGMRGDRGPTSGLPAAAFSVERASHAFGGRREAARVTRILVRVDLDP